MTIAFKALAALLTYPEPELVEALPEIRAALEDERRLPREARRALGELVNALDRADLLESQERYVALFDRGRATSLHLFEHVHGDSRDRGQAMVDLNEVYARAGLALSARELPDYLPALLEFLSLQPMEVAREMLSDCAHIVRKLGDALAARRSPYAAVPAAVLAMVGQPGLADTPPPIEEEKPLDQEWAEEPVIFGPEAAPKGCGTAGAAADPRATARPLPPRSAATR